MKWLPSRCINENAVAKMLLVEMPTSAVEVDAARYPDREESFLFPHLLHYCSKFEPLPAITVRMEGKHPVVIRGHKYVEIARRLGRPTIRAVVAAPPDHPEVMALLERADTQRLSWDDIKATEATNPIPYAWHVFFFENRLSADDVLVFRNMVDDLFANVDENGVRVHYDDDLKLAEFRAKTPVTDESWARVHLAAFSRFSQERVRILSYQGRKFPTM
jgi:hypothetical protein